MAALSLTLACGDYDLTRALTSSAVRPQRAEPALGLEPERAFDRDG